MATDSQAALELRQGLQQMCSKLVVPCNYSFYFLTRVRNIKVPRPTWKIKSCSPTLSSAASTSN